MSIKFLVICLFSICARPALSYSIELSLYYESKCPDTVKFILNELKPAMDLLHEYVTIRFIPFGNSESVNFGLGGFTCQHGHEECRGNMIQDCTLNHMRDRTMRAQLDYVVCEMETMAAASGDYQCVEGAGVSKHSVKSCVSSSEGRDLQLRSERLTNIVNPEFIPTVTFNGRFDQQIQDGAMRDLIATLCSELDNPRECSEYYNRMALRTLLRSAQDLSSK